MEHLHDRQQKILNYLLENPEGATAEKLMEACGVTKTAALSHINQLLTLNYLSFNDQVQGVGRPKRFYFLTDQALESFPRQYSWLANIVLEKLVKDFDSKQTSKFLKEMALSIVDSLKPTLEKLPEHQRMIEIVKKMNELGYRVKVKEHNKADSSYVVEAINCVYHDVAKTHPQLCEFDIHFLKGASGKQVKLEQCIARGANSCRFCLK